MRQTDEPRAFAFAVGVIGGLGGALGGSGNPPKIQGSGFTTTTYNSAPNSSTTNTTNTFAERLFHSRVFGKNSSLFGNSQFSPIHTPGLLNKPGSRFKIGWSGERQEMNFFAPRYSNGLLLDGRTMGRSSFTGGGRQFRITFGARGNQGIQHLYIPRTFVPDSIANPYMIP